MVRDWTIRRKPYGRRGSSETTRDAPGVEIAADVTRCGKFDSVLDEDIVHSCVKAPEEK